MIINYSDILENAYQQFLLDLGGKKVPAPYRINVPFQPDRRFYGKSDPKELILNTENIAKEKGFDLNSASIEEIRKFMEENWLGIDCSGLVYHLLDNLLKKTGQSLPAGRQGGMQKIGFPKASSTNVAKLTSPEFTEKIEDWEQAKPGDMVKINSDDLDHILIVLQTNNNVITYVHSSKVTHPSGVHTGEIINGKFPEDLSVFRYNEDKGDGIYRLKIL